MYRITLFAHIDTTKSFIWLRIIRLIAFSVILKGQYIDMEAVQLCIISLPVKPTICMYVLYVWSQELKMVEVVCETKLGSP